MQAATDFHLQKVYHCPYSLHVLDEIADSGFRSLNEILIYLQELNNFPSEKIYCVCINKKALYVRWNEYHYIPILEC